MTLKKYIDSQNYCIVGNSPCELGRKQGKNIDSFKYVIRFNDFSLDPQYSEHYGIKVNLWVRATNDHVIASLDEKHKLAQLLDLVVLRAESSRNEVSRIYYQKNNIKYCLIPPKLEEKLTRSLEASPSTGLLFLYWVYILNQKKKINSGRLFGFSNFAENPEKKAEKSIHYFSQKASQGYLLSKHSPEKEKKFFKKLVNYDTK